MRANMKLFELEFKGYYGENHLGKFPNKAGVYCIYAGHYVEDKKLHLDELLYIGQAESLKDRLTEKHDHLKKCQKRLKNNQELLFSYASVPSDDLDRVEAALIFYHQPPVNEKCTESFNYSDTHITTSDNNKFLDTDFIVKEDAEVVEID